MKLGKGAVRRSKAVVGAVKVKGRRIPARFSPENMVEVDGCETERRREKGEEEERVSVWRGFGRKEREGWFTAAGDVVVALEAWLWRCGSYGYGGWVVHGFGGLMVWLWRFGGVGKKRVKREEGREGLADLGSEKF
ncbi:uncharacterized protein G2W53_041046 [Senna tora]|uniref:Uncharacterized protein n=1 Tax=Senna tora TaxID=362788 RepID=A0A834VYW1_9FABA|nr:uncharacterized protein G2W53_041046 [Senna tora]